MDNLTYVYQSGRLKRSKSQNIYPKDFFYGLDELKKSFSKTTVIEFEEVKNIKISKFFYRLLRKASGLPFYTENINSMKNRITLFKSDLIMLTNQRMGFSCLPLLFINKIFRKQRSCVFIMGLYNVEVNNVIKRNLRKIFIYFFMLIIDKLIFLSEGEYTYAVNKYKNLSKKFKFIPFSIDTEFWNGENTNKKIGNKILFIGNDGKRDYSFVINLAREMEEFEFTFVTKKIDEKELLSKNIKLINGIWNDETLSDEEIKELYLEADIVIIPILESLQPSGQSVALQAMSLGTVVLITETNGFWEPEVYKHLENIIFIKENTIEDWEKEIMNILSSSDLKNKIENNAFLTVRENNNLENFNRELKLLLL